MNGTELKSLSVFFDFDIKSHTRTLADIFKLTNFEVCIDSQ